MNMRQRSTKRRSTFRRGVSMLELVIAGSMLAGVMTSMSLVMRTARDTWEVSDTEAGAVHQMHAVARHFVRAAREATDVIGISPDGRSITLQMRDGTTNQWSWISSSGALSDVVSVRNSAVATSAVLAQNIQSLTFRGFEADGVTAVTTADDMRLVEVTVEINVPNAATAARRIQSKVWMRSW